jgi:hypothetical protein
VQAQRFRRGGDAAHDVGRQPLLEARAHRPRAALGGGEGEQRGEGVGQRRHQRWPGGVEQQAGA